MIELIRLLQLLGHGDNTIPRDIYITTKVQVSFLLHISFALTINIVGIWFSFSKYFFLISASFDSKLPPPHHAHHAHPRMRRSFLWCWHHQPCLRKQLRLSRRLRLRPVVGLSLAHRRTFSVQQVQRDLTIDCHGDRIGGYHHHGQIPQPRPYHPPNAQDDACPPGDKALVAHKRAGQGRTRIHCWRRGGVTCQRQDEAGLHLVWVEELETRAKGS